LSFTLETRLDMTLNLFTPLFRSGMLSKVKDSIPNHPDINWVVVLCEERDILKKECQDLNVPFLTIPEPEELASVQKKVNKALENLKPGFFQGIDDDTTFNQNSYEVFKRYQQYKMIVGQQILKDGTIREAQKPKHCYTDGAQALISTDLLKTIRFGCFTKDPVADCNFLLECWNACDESARLIVPEVISNYNFLR